MSLHDSSLPGCHFYHCRSQELVAEAIATLHLLNNRVRLDLAGLFGRDGLVYVRVEKLADRRHDFDAEAFEHAAELPVDEFDAVQEVSKLFRLLDLDCALGVERALKIVEHWEEAAELNG